jgi:hypothetical protein
MKVIMAHFQVLYELFLAGLREKMKDKILVVGV